MIKVSGEGILKDMFFVFRCDKKKSWKRKFKIVILGVINGRRQGKYKSFFVLEKVFVVCQIILVIVLFKVLFRVYFYFF